jgi:hypothetical protein
MMVASRFSLSMADVVNCLVLTILGTDDVVADFDVDQDGSMFNWKKQLVVQDNMQQRAADLQPAVVVNKSQFPEPVHEKAEPRAGMPIISARVPPWPPAALALFVSSVISATRVSVVSAAMPRAAKQMDSSLS